MLKTPVIVNDIKEVKLSSTAEHNIPTFTADIDLQYDGLISLNIETVAKLSLTVAEFNPKISITANINSFHAIIRACLVPVRYGKSW